MNKALIILFALALSGCVVSQETYQSQYVQSRELEAKNEDLDSRNTAQAKELEELGSKLARIKAELEELKGEHQHATQSLAEVNKRLERCQSTRVEFGAELDVSKKSVRKAALENEELREEMADQSLAFQERIAGLEAEIAGRDESIEKLRSRISTLEADRDVINEQKELLESEKREKLDEMSKTYEGLLTSMEEEINEGRVTISKLKGQLTVNMVDEILFPSGSATVKEEGKAVLSKVAEALITMEDKMVAIEGHTDDVPIIGGLAQRFPTNWELSTARAVSVVRYLGEVEGLDQTRLTATGYGEFHPVAENDTEEGRVQNRRIEIKLLPIEPPPEEEGAEPEEQAPPGESGEEPVQSEGTAGDEEQATESVDEPAAAEDGEALENLQEAPQPDEEKDAE